MEDLSKLHRNIDRFYSTGYLACWCSIVRSDWSRFLAEIFNNESNDGNKLQESNDCKLLDVGCGPSNRDEVERFKTNAEDAFQWQHYFDFVSDLEPNTPIEDIMHRTRNAIKKIVFCDVTKENLFSTSDDEVVNYCQYFNDKIEEKFNSFDIIIASLVFDVVAVNRKMFKDALENVVRYLKPGGHIIIQGSLGEHCYTVGSSMFPAMTADKDLVFGIFQELQLDVVKWQTINSEPGPDPTWGTTHYFSLLRK